jgi:hypothetical protein
MTRLTDIKALPTSEAVRKLNPDLFSGPSEMPSKESLVTRHAVTKEGKRLRQSASPLMNKLETRFYETKLKVDYVGETILIQAVRLELARGHWYKPDFFLPAVLPSVKDETRFRPAIAYEVKGPKAFRGGFENLKVAARVHPWVRFFLVWEDKGTGKWERQEILP